MLKKILILPIFLLLFTSGNLFAQQKYRSHIVQSGETLETISKKYNISERDILKLNPDAKEGVRENAVIILPNGVIDKPSNGLSFIVHKVKKRETLFSLSQKYSVSIDDIKKYNKELYARGLNKNEKIRIPQGIETAVSAETIDTTTTATNTTSPESTTDKHTVQPKETVYGIARMYGITMNELVALNPGLTSDLPIGTVLNVPGKAVTATANIDDEQYGFYTVKQKEGFYRLEKELGLAEEEIIALNPYAKDGLKEGMILKIPKGIAGVTASGAVAPIDLSATISNRSTKRIAIMLPFQLAKADMSSDDANEEVLKGSSVMRVSLDFYSGVTMATAFFKDKGVSTIVDVYDTEGKEATVSSIINSNSFENTDAVIGPLLGKTVSRAAADLKQQNIPVFSPISNKGLKMSRNLFKTIPSDELLGERLINYMKPLSADKNVIIITDNKNAAEKAKLIAAFPTAKIITLNKDKGYIYVADLDKQLITEKDNWVILSSDSPITVSNVVPTLDGIPGDYTIRLFAMEKNNAYETNDVSNVQLANLNFTFPSVNKSYDYKAKNAFLVSYKNKYGVMPNRFAVRGFDVTYDVLLRLANDEDIYAASSSDFMTEYIENRFRYEKKTFSGYENKALYVLKYTDKLQFEVLE